MERSIPIKGGKKFVKTTENLQFRRRNRLVNNVNKIQKLERVSSLTFNVLPCLFGQNEWNLNLYRIKIGFRNC